MEEFAKKPVHYESQFDIASGQYNFKVVFSAGGENFGKIEKPLVIEPFDGKQFAVSALALGELHKSEARHGHGRGADRRQGAAGGARSAGHSRRPIQLQPTTRPASIWKSTSPA